MAKTEYYVQCTLEKDVGDKDCVTLEVKGKVTQVTWIPEKFAVLGMILKLKSENQYESVGRWEGAWKVVYCGARKSANLTEIDERTYTKHRDYD